jgi:isopentenyl phosphate kinase
VKLGGSAVTVKHQHETLKAEVLSSVVQTLKQLYDNLQQQQVQEQEQQTQPAGVL